MINSYSFKPFKPADISIVRPWLLTPLVNQWYPDPDYIEELKDQLKDTRIQMRLVEYEARAFAYIQDYHIHGWADHHLSFLPSGSRGLDTFIGKPAMIGHGHGTAYIGMLVDLLFKSGVPALGIDPHPDNQSAIRAYEKVGFKKNKTIKSEWGPCQLMSIHR